MKKKLLMACGLVLALNVAYSDGRYCLCGSDEDGCHDYRSCACIPYNEQEAGNPFCLDLDHLRCIPLSQDPDCYVLFRHTNQEQCLATLFQSGPHPACELVSHDFCKEHQIAECNAEGQLDTC